MGKLYIGLTQVNMAVNQPNYTNGAGKMFINVNSLPDGYTKLEYIQSTGTQYIDTQYLCSPTTVPNTRYVLEGYASNIAVGNNWWANGIGGNDNLSFYVGLNYYNSALYFVYGDGKAGVRTNSTGSYNTRYKWDLDMYHSTYKVWDSTGTQLLVDITPDKQTPTASQYLTLCRWRYAAGSTGYLFSMRIYNVELYTSDALKMKLVPALRNSDSKPGLYDVVNDCFYTNDGTGEFVYAYPEDKELPSAYKKVEYIQSSGTQHIDTGHPFSYGDYFEFEFKQVYNNGAIVSPTSENKGYGAGTDLNLNITAGGGKDGGGSSSSYDYMRAFIYNSGRTTTPSLAYSTMPDHLYTDVVNIGTTTYWSMRDNDNGTLYTISSVSTPNATSYNSGNNIHLCKDDSSSYPFGGAKKLYRCTLVKNGVLVLDLRPCIRVSDSKPGLYNLVNDTFYHNQGSGEFTYQDSPASDASVKFFNIIKTRPYYGVSYLEDTYGDCYINTGVKLNQDSYVSCEFTVTQYQTNFSLACSPFGARTGWQNNAFSFHIPVNNSTTICFSYGSQVYSIIDSDILNRSCVIVANKNNWSMTGGITASKTFTYTAFQNSGNCYMFNTNFYSENPPTGMDPSDAHLRISSFSIHDNGTVIRDFVPKVRNDGKPGMYDLCGSICPLTGTPFYINAGLHEFSYQV